MRKSALQLNLFGTEEDSRSYTCCFAGHRQITGKSFNENENFDYIKRRTEEEILRAIELGYKNFISGMALGFDMLCAEIILELKEKFSFIKLFCALPCNEQEKLWKESQKERYFNILEKADKIVCLQPEYSRGCMQKRNKFMIDNSSYLIAFYTGVSGGTKQTIEYALKNGLKIVTFSC